MRKSLLKIIETRLANIESLLVASKTVLSLEEAAVYSGYSTSTLYKYSAAGFLPCSKPNGKYIFIEKVALDNWLLRKNKKSHTDLNAEANTYITLNK